MKIYFETLGCPKNECDTQMAQGILEKAGHAICLDPAEADVIVVNTCAFINDAKTESIERIFDMCAYKEAGKKLVVSGCLAQRYSRELLEEMPEVDAFVGVNDYENLPALLDSLMTGGARPALVDTPPEAVLASGPRKLDAGLYSATLRIAEGCNNRCAYCVIPSIRGPFRSKRREDVLAEAKALAAAGCKELILIAQDVTNYGIDLYGERCLPALLTDLCRIDGIRWIRLMYCYEDRISDELTGVMAREPKICHYIDMPIQHCNDRILAAMGRRSTKKSILSTIERLRQAIPDIHIRTTLIVGFPGETEEEFTELTEFVESVRFDRLGVFAYSQEEDTPAGQMEDQIPEEIKAARVDEIMACQLNLSLASNQKKVGSILPVLVEGRDGEDGSYIGRTAYDAPDIDNAVLFTSSRALRPGDMVQVRITDAFDYGLWGTEDFS